MARETLLATTSAGLKTGGEGCLDTPEAYRTYFFNYYKLLEYYIWLSRI